MLVRLERARRVGRREDGFTMIELLFAMMLGLLVLALAGTVMVTASRTQPGQAKRGVSIQNARTTMDRLVREIRQGSTIYTASASQLSLLTMVDNATCGGATSTTAIPCKVTYTCTAGSCTRTVADPPPGTGTGTAVTVVSGLSSSSVFGYGTGCSSTGSTTPGYICATLTFPSGGDDAITLQDGATPLNPTSS